MRNIHCIIILLLLSGSIEAQRITITDALHLNEELDYKTQKPVRIVEKNTSFKTNNKEINDKIIKTFDQAGMLLTYEFYDDIDKLFARATILNDTLHRIKLRQILEVWSQNGSSKQTSLYTYDSKYFLKEATDFDDNGNLIRKSSIVCNDKGHPIELSLFDNKGKLFVKEKAIYFYNTNMVISNVETPDGQIVQGNDSSKISLKNESAFKSTSEVYNMQGDKVRWKGNRDVDKDMIYEREYVYDHFGNWIESKIFLVTFEQSGEPLKKIKSIISREITYQ